MDVSVRGNRPLCTGKGACIAHGISESLSDEPLDLKSDIKEGQSIKIRLKFDHRVQLLPAGVARGGAGLAPPP